MDNNQQRITADHQRLTRNPRFFFRFSSFVSSLKWSKGYLWAWNHQIQISFWMKPNFIFLPGSFSDLRVCPVSLSKHLFFSFDIVFWCFFLLILTDIRIFIAEQKHERTILHLCVYLQFCSLWRTVCMERVKRKGHDSTIQGTEEIYWGHFFVMSIFRQSHMLVGGLEQVWNIILGMS